MDEEEEKEVLTALQQYRAARECEESDIEQILDVTRNVDTVEIAQDLLHEDNLEATEARTSDVRAELGKLAVPQKIKAAMFGNAIVRGILIYDPNRMIQDFTLRNPRLTLPEVESFTKNPNISDNVLRLLSRKKEWMRYYSIKFNLVCNPKTPSDISMKWLRHMNEGDLKKLSRSKGIPQLIATTAGKLLESHQH